MGVSEAYLPGAAAFVTVRASHTFIMNHPQVIESTAEFLRRGSLRGATATSGDDVEEVAD